MNKNQRKLQFLLKTSTSRYKTLKFFIRNSVFVRSLYLLSQRDRRIVGVVVAIQVFLGLIDLIAVALLGALGALSVSGVQSQNPGTRVSAMLDFLKISDLSFQAQAGLLGVAAGSMLIIRTAISVFFLRKIYTFLSRRGADISAKLVRSVLSKNFIDLQSQSNQSIVFASTEGVRTVTLGVLGTAISLISDLSLLVVMAAGLFFVDPVIAFSTFIVFSFVAFALYKLVSQRVLALGVSTTQDAIRSSELLSEVLVNYREAFVRNRREFYASEIGVIRRRVSEDMAELAFIPNISKYAIEAFVVLGALLISGIQFYLQDASHAVATLAIFLAAGTRIAPAVLRIQQGAVAIKGSLGTALPTLDLIDEVPRDTDLKAESEISDFKHEGFNPEIELVNICLKYPVSEAHSLTSVNLKIYSGQTVAIVGKSGAGKTSLVDVILGVISPTAGDVLISGVQPTKAIYKWPGAISYVPQDVSLIQGSLYENITLGFPADESNLPRVERAVTLSKLSELVSQLPLGLETQVGERGAKLSGGQRQRLGIARALFTNPKLIVLDEATSALDGETESQVSDSLASLRGKVTIVLIAHRLSSIRHADQVVYISDGAVKAQGTFQEVRDQVPDFDRQAILMGL